MPLVIRSAWLLAPVAAVLLSACGSTRGNCSPSNCAGCCDAQSFCQLNFTSSACGRLGAKCEQCAAGNTCSQGVCTLYATGGGTGGSGGGAGGAGGGGAGGGGAGGGGAADAGTDGGADAGDSGVADAGPTRFSTTSTYWPVPASALPDGFLTPKIGLTIRVWDTFDIDGDGKPDLVHTANPATGNVWVNAGSGMAFWRVYKNTGAGFAAAPVAWALPASGLADGFFAASSAVKLKQWATFDIDGDGKPDLVQTASPTTDQIWPGNVWKVFKNLGTGFSATATSWAVPAAPLLPLPDGYNAKDSAAAPKAWSTFDIDGDQRPDLVLTSTGGSVFMSGTQAQWRVHRNTGTGFAPASTAFNVPASGLAEGFTMPNSAVSLRQWATIDLDGDGLPDLVHTANTSTNSVFGSAAAPFWRFYKNLGTSFAASFAQWPVPPNGFADGFQSTEAQATTRRWTTRDLTGDDRPDLVQTANPANGQVWGTDAGVYWNVYRNTGMAFSTTALQWTVPFSGLPEGFFTHASNASLNRWLSFDLDGDGVTDLVHTGNTAVDAVWGADAGAQPNWKLYRAEQ